MVVALALAAAAPAVVVAVALLFTGDHSTRLRWTLTVVVVLSWLPIYLTVYFGPRWL